MAFATVYFIPSHIEPFCWLAIFIICAYIIAKKCSEKYFLNGLCVSLVNAIWITAIHIILFDTYIANQAQAAAIYVSNAFAWFSRINDADDRSFCRACFRYCIRVFCFYCFRDPEKDCMINAREFCNETFRSYFKQNPKLSLGILFLLLHD